MRECGPRNVSLTSQSKRLALAAAFIVAFLFSSCAGSSTPPPKVAIPASAVTSSEIVQALNQQLSTNPWVHGWSLSPVMSTPVSESQLNNVTLNRESGLDTLNSLGFTDAATTNLRISRAGSPSVPNIGQLNLMLVRFSSSDGAKGFFQFWQPSPAQRIPGITSSAIFSGTGNCAQCEGNTEIFASGQYIFDSGDSCPKTSQCLSLLTSISESVGSALKDH